SELDIAASMEDLEAQIAKAADELAREGRAAAEQESLPAEEPTAAKVKVVSMAAASQTQPEELRPAEPEPSSTRPSPFQAANDDRQKDYRLVLQGMSRRPPTTVYWVTGLLSLLWIGGGILLGSM